MFSHAVRPTNHKVTEIVQGSTTLCGHSGGPGIEEARELKKVGDVVDRNQNMIFVGLISDLFNHQTGPECSGNWQGFYGRRSRPRFCQKPFIQEKSRISC